jgi:hypothetical protein
MSLAPGDPMDPNWVPGPDDHWRGVIEIDCREGWSDELKELVRQKELRKAAKNTAAGGTPAPADPPPPDAPPPAGG